VALSACGQFSKNDARFPGHCRVFVAASQGLWSFFTEVVHWSMVGFPKWCVCRCNGLGQTRTRVTCDGGTTKLQHPRVRVSTSPLHESPCCVHLRRGAVCSVAKARSGCGGCSFDDRGNQSVLHPVCQPPAQRTLQHHGACGRVCGRSPRPSWGWVRSPLHCSIQACVNGFFKDPREG
jgi:hypothetical protein